MRGLHPVWKLNLVLAAGVLAAVVVVARTDAGALADPHVPWWALGLLVVLTERYPIHLEFRRSAHAFSMTEIPLVLGLLFSTPASMLLGIGLGTAVAIALRRMPRIKLAFNVLEFILCAAVAIGVLRLVAGGSDPDVGLASWLGAILGLQLSGLLGIALVCTAMRLSDGDVAHEQVQQMVVVDSVVTLTNTSLALLLGLVLVERPEAAAVIALPAGLVFAAYRQLAAERERREKLQFLYETNRTFLAAPGVTEAIGALLDRARDAFRAEQAEVVLFSAEAGVEPMRVALVEGRSEPVIESVSDPAALELLALVTREERPVALDAPFGPGGAAYLATRGAEATVVAALRGEERVVGFLVLANRTGIVPRFTPDDLALVETLAANASAALQYDRLEQTVRELRLLQERLHHDAFHDGLTGLANRALFHREVAGLLDAGEQEVAVVFLDLDDFKAVNDTFGHALGDELLARVAERLRSCLAATGTTTVARLGGDEFAAVVVAPSGVEGRAAGAARAILDAFRDAVLAEGRSFRVSMSVGIATSRHSGGNAPDLLRDADVAMYEAKAAGKSRWSLFDPAMRDAILERHELRAQLERAIAEGELVVHFQPIVDVATRGTVAVEALVRWDHPERGMVPPGQFIGLAEETGLIVPLGAFVLREACERAAGWRSAGLDGAPLGVHVNLSARELEDPGIVASVSAALDATGIEPRQLVLELTESLLVQDAERGARTLTGLRNLGVRLSLDDFGTGFSSLSYLRTLPLDQLKIAREFVDGLGRHPDDEAFVRLILELAKGIGLEVVAEGVETAEQFAQLKALGCDLAQGYWLARPGEARDVAAAVLTPAAAASPPAAA